MRTEQVQRIVLAVAAVLLLAGVEDAAGQACPQPTTQANFDASKYVGPWLEMRSTMGSFEQGGTCGSANYEAKSDGTIAVTNRNYLPSRSGYYTANLVATPVTPNAPDGKFTVQFQGPSKSMYWVLGTDYDSYAVVYSCSDGTADTSNIPQINMWVLSRSVDKYNDDAKKKVSDILTNNKLTNVKLSDQGQTCPPLTCSGCKVAKEKLDASKMVGRWWEVQHSLYATDGDTTSCNYADLSAVTGGVSFNVSNDMVSGESFKEVKKGLILKPVGDSGKGEFNPVGGDPNDRVCVVDTDYDNYAVLSICVKAPASTTISPAGGVPPMQVDFPASGGLFVVSRKNGLSAEKQMEANKAVVSFGWPSSAMLPTPSSPCPASAFVVPSGASALVAGERVLALLVATALALALRH